MMKYFLILITLSSFLNASNVIVNGFGSLTLSSMNGIDFDQSIYIDQKAQVGSDIDIKSGSLFGVQATVDMDYFQAIGQGIFRKTFDSEIYQPELEWLFLKTDITNELSVRIGRMRIPAFLFSQTLYVDYARNFAKLPIELYTALPFTNYDGIELSYTKDFNNYIFNAFIGLSKESKYDNIADSGDTLLSGFKINDIFITSLSLENENFMIKGTYIKSKLNLDSNQYSAQYDLSKTFFPDLYNDYAPINKDNEVITIGGEYYLDDIVLSGEWARRSTDSAIATSKVYYLSASYNLTDKLTPYLYFSRMKYIQKTDPRIEAEPATIVEAIKLNLLKNALDEISVLNGNNDSSKSRCIGIKYSLSNSVSTKLEIVNVKDENFDKDYNMFHLSMDFFF